MADNAGMVKGLGKRIALERKGVGLSAIALAEKVGVHRNTLAKWERGETEPTTSELFKISSAVGCDLFALLGIEAPSPIPRFAHHLRKESNVKQEIVVKARKFLRAYDDIEEILDTRLPGKLRSYEFDPEETPWKRWIESAAEDLRDQSGMRNRSPEDILLVLENLGVRCLLFRSDHHELDGFSILYRDLPFIMLRDRDKGIERTIFSAAHELGHLVLHPHLFTVESAKPAKSDRDHEQEADYFADCFLVPGDDLIRVWKEEQLHRLDAVSAILILKAVFRVGFFCLYRRLRDLGLCGVEYAAMVEMLEGRRGAEGGGRIEDLELAPLPSEVLQRTTRFERLVESAFLQEEIGVSKVAELFQITVDRAMKETNRWRVPKIALVG